MVSCPKPLACTFKGAHNVNEENKKYECQKVFSISQEGWYPMLVHSCDEQATRKEASEEAVCHPVGRTPFDRTSAVGVGVPSSRPNSFRALQMLQRDFFDTSIAKFGKSRGRNRRIEQRYCDATRCKHQRAT